MANTKEFIQTRKIILQAEQYIVKYMCQDAPLDFFDNEYKKLNEEAATVPQLDMINPLLYKIHGLKLALDANLLQAEYAKRKTLSHELKEPLSSGEEKSTDMCLVSLEKLTKGENGRPHPRAATYFNYSEAQIKLKYKNHMDCLRIAFKRNKELTTSFGASSSALHKAPSNVPTPVTTVTSPAKKLGVTP